MKTYVILLAMILCTCPTPAFAEELEVWGDAEEPSTVSSEAKADEEEEMPEAEEIAVPEDKGEEGPKDRLKRSYVFAHYMLGVGGSATNNAFLFRNLEAEVAAQGLGLGVLTPLGKNFLLSVRLAYFGLAIGQITEGEVAMMSFLPVLRLPLGESVDILAQFGVGTDFTNHALHGEAGIFVSVGDHTGLFLNFAYLSHSLDTYSGSPWEYSLTSLNIGLAIGR